jgi:hypothetical protein
MIPLIQSRAATVCALEVVPSPPPSGAHPGCLPLGPLLLVPVAFCDVVAACTNGNAGRPSPQR